VTHDYQINYFAMIDSIERYWTAKSPGDQPESPDQKGGAAAQKNTFAQEPVG